MPKRWDIIVRAGAWTRSNLAAEYRLENFSPPSPAAKLRCLELDGQGAVIDADVPCQVDMGARSPTIVWLLRDRTEAGCTRRYRIEESSREGAAAAQRDASIELTDDVMHQGGESYRIRTPAATYIYHKRGAGFASLFDRDGNDWLSYRPYGGSDGVYRGIPNLAHPENHFHPGGTGCRSRISSAGPLKVAIASESLDGKWACRWEIYGTHARLTVLKVDHPYWFLYEGTPGGKLDEAGDYCVFSDGTRRALSERWEQALPDPEWIYFGAANLERVLYLAHHEADQHIDSYWPMEKNMTVFGFGRDGLKKYLTDTPAQFTIGLAESSNFDDLADIIASVTQPLTISAVE